MSFRLENNSWSAFYASGVNKQEAFHFQVCSSWQLAEVN